MNIGNLSKTELFERVQVAARKTIENVRISIKGDDGRL